MNHNDPTNKTDDIVKYLAGEATPAEAMALEDWLIDPANAEEFEHVYQLWQRLPGAPVLLTPAVDGEWQELQERLRAGSKPSLLRRIGPRMAVAASIGLLVIATVGWWLSARQVAAPSPNALTEQQATGADNSKQITMPDGSAITLHHNSAIQYAGAFGTTHRHLQLQGEAFFEVVPDSTRPFTIRIADVTIKVVGTAFNVKDITPSGNIEVQVLSGVVNMITDQQQISVRKGQSGTYDASRKSLRLSDTVDINSMSYATHSFEFDNVPLREVYASLGKTFNRQFRFEDPATGDCRVTARFDQRSLEYILQIIDATLNLHSSQQGNTIVITGVGCPAH
ncbi:FecR domain-containing protein [Paraflavitalea pollutisoli]|uniref:FecR domain-containing protein n=1 Tax=Paraflavitalea pollutisoli TaxID=3034143 RepID=UPI0023EA8B84|nr:FecR domain-containing protein [Paraflavitalea sp. H1-2-19X]